MPLTENQQIRFIIQDIPTYYDNAAFVGDGTANSFALPNRNLTTASAYVPAAGGWSATGATFDSTLGIVAFTGAISALSGFRVTYVHSVFSDAELDHYVSAAGGVNGAALQCAYALLFDGLKRAKWRSPDGSEYDDSKAVDVLKDIVSALKDEIETETIFGGSMASWSITQSEY